jgi:hypothetical protein
MIAEGKIAITLTPQLEGRCHVGIASSRRPLPQGFFIGKAGDRVAAALPRLFAICAMAQGSTAAAACEAATAAIAEPALIAKRRLLVRAEQIREHMFRLLTGAAEVLAEKPSAEDLALLSDLSKSLRQATGDLDRSAWRSVINAACTTVQRLVDRHLFAADYRAAPDSNAHPPRLSAQFVDWCDGRRTPIARLGAFFIDRDLATLGADGGDRHARPLIDQADLLTRLLGPEGDAFAMQPDCDGTSPETTAFSHFVDHPLIVGLYQQFGDSVLTRLAARQIAVSIAASDLPELANAAADSLTSPFSVTKGQNPDGDGIAVMETARGRLAHATRMRDGKIAAYRILAPTEWNFHPRGPVARRLAAMAPQASLSLERRARLLVETFDPCVAFSLTVH